MARRTNQKAANKFVFTSDSSTIGYQQNHSFQMILGDQNLFDLNGEDHKRVRGAHLYHS
ncbi:hypothetical protein FH972_020366 [Carpinus fangiana]|uniref:Cytochrome P450 n=1 Tax=Carpinus fangiana TaxID=176857 RepID=A0A5N6RWH3_9ROSI|nr:hypothetical protein FH972_020366 [Carpinus fangiana]